MNVWNKLKSLFESTPPSPPPSRAELQARLDKVRGHIRENQREIEIGSWHSSRGCGNNIIRLREEEHRLQTLLDSTL